MRFSTALSSNARALAPAEGKRVHADAQVQEAPRPASVSVQPPWPADAPPDDLDQRVRQVGEWQLGDW